MCNYSSDKMADGFNHFDIVYVINLEHRTDRWEHITNELNKTCIDANKIQRINAVYEEGLGQLGCSKSHILALETFLRTDETVQHALILEDDFMFSETQDVVNTTTNQFFEHIHDYDVVMLASSTKLDEPCEHPFVRRALKAHTTAGYAVNRKFAEQLLQNYREGAALLDQNRHEDKSVWIQYAIDAYMNNIVPTSKWYCFHPKLAKQLPSYSDIEYNYCDYGV